MKMMGTSCQQEMEQRSNMWSFKTHDHSCTVYTSNEELKRQFVPYLQSGLLLGERCIYFAHEHNADFVIDAMKSDDFDVQRYIDGAAFLVISTADAHLRTGRFDEGDMIKCWTQTFDAAQDAGFPAIRAAVDMTWALSGLPGCEILSSYEARLNTFTDSHPISIMCQYHRTRFGAEKIKSLVHAHPIVVAEDTVLDNPLFVPAASYIEGSPDIDLQVTFDNLRMIKQLRDSLKAKEVIQRGLDQKSKEYQVLYDDLRLFGEKLPYAIEPLRLFAQHECANIDEDGRELISNGISVAQSIEQRIADILKRTSPS